MSERKSLQICVDVQTMELQRLSYLGIHVEL